MNLSSWVVLLLLVVSLCSCKARNSGGTPTALPPDTEQTLLEVTRKLTREGYRTLIGRLPLEEQLAEAWRYQRDKGADGEARFFVASAKVRGQNFNVARMQAESLAKVQLAGLMETRIGQLVTNQLETGYGNPSLQTVGSSKNLVKARLSNLYPLMEIYKDFPDGTVEVQLMLGCERNWAHEIAGSLVAGQEQ